MDDATRHPDDAVLFDLVEGSLDPEQAELVDDHVAHCSACAALVAAARSGRDAASGGAVELPADRAEQLTLAVRAAWRQRRVDVLAAEQADEDQPVIDSPVTVARPEAGDEVLESIPTGRALPRSRRARRLVPILAFGVLATLAGTSVYIGEDRPTAPDRATTGGGTVASEGSGGDDVESGRTGPAEDATADGAEGADAPSSGLEAPVGAGPIEGDPTASTPRVTPGAPSDASVELAPEGLIETDHGAQGLDEPTCIATRDERELVLPDGRIPQRIERGPLGIYLVCG